MPPKKKTWREKLADSKDFPKVGKIEGNMTRRWGTGTMVIPAPIEVDEVMRKVPKGKVVTINEIRAYLAKKHRATIGCPITTGIFAWIAAHAAEEAADAGAKRITPSQIPPGSRRTLRGSERQTIPGRRFRARVGTPVRRRVRRAWTIARAAKIRRSTGILHADVRGKPRCSFARDLWRSFEPDLLQQR
jgi:hypothetical protein